MNPSASILNFKSIRFKNQHFDIASFETREMRSINEAKRESRRLGGASGVIAAKSAENFRELKKLTKVEACKRDLAAAEERLDVAMREAGELAATHKVEEFDKKQVQVANMRATVEALKATLQEFSK